MATPERVVVDPSMASDETTAAPRGELSMRGGAAAPAGYHAVLVAWTDGGYDSTWTTQAPYSPRITHRVELRPERTGVRVEYVPDDARDLVLVCMDSPRTRYAHFDYWSTYRPTANGGIRFESVHYRPSGAVQVIRAYPGPGESVTVQHTHPHRGGLRPWE
ncbi:MAG: hypothetical protein ACREJC_17425 [Tepidisphaeraceae bacterium]